MPEQGREDRTPRPPNFPNRCGNTIHSNYVTDHRCLLLRDHEGDCCFGNFVGVIELAKVQTKQRREARNA